MLVKIIGRRHKNHLYEPRDKFRSCRVEVTEQMHSDTRNPSRQVGPHSIHTWAGYRHRQNKNAWLNVERTHARGEPVTCHPGVSDGLDGESRARHEFDAHGRGPRTDGEGEVWWGNGSMQGASAHYKY